MKIRALSRITVVLYFCLLTAPALLAGCSNSVDSSAEKNDAGTGLDAAIADEDTGPDAGDGDNGADGSVDGSADTGCRWRKIYEGAGYFHGIWGASTSDLFVTGGSESESDSIGIILHYDGVSWSGMNIPEDIPGLVSIWGSSDTDVFAVGNKSGLILHFNGDEWEKMHEYGDMPMMDIWGSTGSDVFAVGYKTGGGVNTNRILHYDGTKWSFMPPDFSGGMYGVWGSSGNDVYFVGGKQISTAIILHYDGHELSEMKTDIQFKVFMDIIGFSFSEIFAVGVIEITGPDPNYYNSGIIQYDGDSFVMIKDGIKEMLNCIGGSSGLDIYVSGIEFNETDGTTPERSVIYHYDGSEWKAMKTDDTWLVNDIWTDSEQEAFAVGEDTANNTGVILHYSCQ